MAEWLKEKLSKRTTVIIVASVLAVVIGLGAYQFFKSPSSTHLSPEAQRQEAARAAKSIADQEAARPRPPVQRR